MSSRVVSSFTTRRWSQTVSQASVFPSCTPRIRSLRAFRKASKKLLLLLLRSLIITTQHKSLHLSNLPIILGAPMGSTLMRDSCGPQSLQPRRCARHDVSRFYPGAHHAKQWYYMARNQAASASRLGSLFVFLVLSRTDKEGHNTVKLVRQRSPKQHPKGCWGLLGLESRQFF